MDLTRIREAVVRSVCRTEPGRISRLTRVEEAVVRRIESDWESHLGSISSTIENRVPAARQSQIIHDCLRACRYLLSNARGVHYHPVSMDRATSLILDTLLILQDRQPPRRPHVCLGKNRHGGICGRRVITYEVPGSTVHAPAIFGGLDHIEATGGVIRRQRHFHVSSHPTVQPSTTVLGSQGSAVNDAA